MDSRAVSTQDQGLDEAVIIALSALERIDSCKGRLALAEQLFNKIGDGSGRSAFDIGQGLVVKVANHERGLDQNHLEMNISEKEGREIINRSLLGSDDGAWLVAPKAEYLDGFEFEARTGLDFMEFRETLYHLSCLDKSITHQEPECFERVMTHPFAKDAIEMCNQWDMPYGDVGRISSWGVVGREVRLVDYGLNREIFKTHYKPIKDRMKAQKEQRNAQSLSPAV